MAEAGATRRVMMKIGTKVVLVLAGYAAALFIALGALWVRLAMTNTADAQASSGMYAAGDLFLFLGVFGTAALVPSSMALIFLRSHRRFWSALGALALVVALADLAALAVYVFGRSAAPGSLLGAWSGFSPLLMLAAPLLTIAFILAAILAPYRSPRIALAVAAALDVAVSVYMAVVWFLPLFHT